MNKKKRYLWISLAALGLVALALGGGWFRWRRTVAARDVEGGEIVTAFVGDLAANASASGQLLASEEARLALGIAGRVERVYVEAGDRVRAGNVLVQLERGDLTRAVESAEQNLAIAEATLADLRAGASASDVAAARASLDSAQAQLDDLLEGPSQQDIAQAEAALVAAEASLDELVSGPSEEQLAQARAYLASAKAALAASKARYEALDDQLIVAENDIHSAQLALDRARDQYNLLVWNDWKAGVSWAPYSPQGIAVKSAEVNYDVALANRTLTEIGVSDAAYRGAEAQVAQAEASLAALTEEKTAQIAAARSQVARAQASLTQLTKEKTAQIAALRAQLAQARATLAKLERGASEEQLAIAEAQVQQAHTALEEAQDNLAKATVLAPFDGLVTDLYVAEGEWAGGPVADVVNTDSLQVALDVDEIDIAGVQVGQSATVSLEAWPERELEGRVASIAPKAQISGGIVTFRVLLDLEPADLPILTGMTANAQLVTAQRRDVLLVRNRAITVDRQAGTYYVDRLEGDDTVQVEVTIGLRDSSYTEITSGLAEGDRLMIKAESNALDISQGPPEDRRGFGGD